MVRMACDIEANIVAVERLLEVPPAAAQVDGGSARPCRSLC